MSPARRTSQRVWIQDEPAQHACQRHGALAAGVTRDPDGWVLVHLAGGEAEVAFPDGVVASTFAPLPHDPFLTTPARALRPRGRVGARRGTSGDAPPRERPGDAAPDPSTSAGAGTSS